MQCPKCKSDLVNGILSDRLITKHCQDCQGEWISGVNYQTWRSERTDLTIDPDFLVKNYDLPHTASSVDWKTAPCPECGRIMSRAKIAIKNAFYLEHCLTCSGIWCDAGEWEVLEKLGLHTNVPQVFSNTWQAEVRASHLNELERQAIVDKIGIEMAERVFDLAEALSKHPNGDFAAAYLMRSLEQKTKGNPYSGSKPSQLRG